MVRIKPERLAIGANRKLSAKSMGPYTILHKIGDNAYLLDLPDDLGVSATFNI